MEAITHLEKVITGEVSAVTYLEMVITGEAPPRTYLQKVITGEAPPRTHLQRVIAGVESPVTHLEHVWAGGSPTPENILDNNITSQEYNGLTVTKNADGSVRVQGTATANSNFYLYNDSHSGTSSSYQLIDNGIYYIGGGIEGGEENKFILSARYDDAEGGTPSRLFRIPYGENIRIDNSNGEYRYLSVYIAVWNGATVDFTCNPYLYKVEE